MFRQTFLFCLFLFGFFCAQIEAQAKHIVLIQPGPFFNLSGLLEQGDTLSYVITDAFDIELAKSAKTNFKLGSFCKLQSLVKDSKIGKYSRIDQFESRIDEIRSCIRSITSESGTVDFILGNLESTIYVASLLNRELGISSYDPNVTLSMRDKVLMKQTLQSKCLVHFPKFRDLSNFEPSDANFNSISDNFRFPIILKPKSQSSSIGVLKIDDINQLKFELRDLNDSGQSLDDFEIEEFIDGKTISIDGIVRDGTLLFLGANLYTHSCLDWVNQKTNCIGAATISGYDLKLRKSIIDFASNTIRSLHFSNGVFHLEAFLNLDLTLTFLEIAPRFIGAGFASMYLDLYGVNLPLEGILAMLDRPSKINSPTGLLSPVTPKERGALLLFRPSNTDISEIDEFDVSTLIIPDGLTTLVSSYIPELGCAKVVFSKTTYAYLASLRLFGNENEVTAEMNKLIKDFRIE